jgi:hypothetical protein
MVDNKGTTLKLKIKNQKEGTTWVRAGVNVKSQIYNLRQTPEAQTYVYDQYN